MPKTFISATYQVSALSLLALLQIAIWDGKISMSNQRVIYSVAKEIKYRKRAWIRKRFNNFNFFYFGALGSPWFYEELWRQCEHFPCLGTEQMQHPYSGEWLCLSLWLLWKNLRECTSVNLCTFFHNQNYYIQFHKLKYILPLRNINKKKKEGFLLFLMKIITQPNISLQKSRS